MGYTTDVKTIPDIMISLLDLVVIGDFKDIINIAKKVIFKSNHIMPDFF